MILLRNWTITFFFIDLLLQRCKKKEKHMEKVYTIEYQNIKKILLQPLHYLFHSWSIKDCITSQVHILSLKMNQEKAPKVDSFIWKTFVTLSLHVHPSPVTMAWYKTGTPEHRTTEQRTLTEQQRNTLKYQQNSNITPADHPGTTEPYKIKNTCSDFTENVNLTLIHLTLSTQHGNIFYYWY